MPDDPNEIEIDLNGISLSQYCLDHVYGRVQAADPGRPITVTFRRVSQIGFPRMIADCGDLLYKALGIEPPPPLKE